MSSVKTLRKDFARKINIKGLNLYKNPNGSKDYYKEGNIHRLDGPSIIMPDSYKESYIKEIFFHKEDLIKKWSNKELEL